ncbi:MAG: LCP family protein [Lachnospiraceae bacterium]|nr:LCP family protein [Lachnospiraceae bacterium]
MAFTLSAFRNFLITLIVSLLVFGFLGYTICGFAADKLHWNDDLPPEESGKVTPVTGGETRPPSETDEGELKRSSFTVLLVGSDYQPDVFDDYDLTELNKEVTGFPVKERKITADEIVLLYVNGERNELSICSIPSETRVTDKGVVKTLGMVYGESGIEYLTEKLTGMTGIRIDYYLSVGIPGMKAIIDEIGPITFNVPVDMEYTDPSEGPEGYEIRLRHGIQRLDGEKALMLLRFNGYRDNGSSRRETGINFLKAVLSKLTTDPTTYARAGELRETFAEYVETNFTEVALTEELDLIFRYPDMKITVLTYPGSVTVSDGKVCYEPDIADGRELFRGLISK